MEDVYHLGKKSKDRDLSQKKTKKDSYNLGNFSLFSTKQEKSPNKVVAVIIALLIHNHLLQGMVQRGL